VSVHLQHESFAICIRRARAWTGITAIACGLGLVSTSTHATGTAVEFFHTGFGHYFVTSTPSEAAALDANPASGWTRTGNDFLVEIESSTSAVPVCRFFSAAFAPKSSHFYTPYPFECAKVKDDPTWVYESIAFHLRLPDAVGNCLPGTVVLYRLYNNGMSGAPNHRYTTSETLAASMQSAGWIAEGTGTTGAFACAPQPLSATKGRLEVTRLTSTKIGYEYEIAIYVPASYDGSKAAYPTIYVLDGDANFTQGGTRFWTFKGVLERRGTHAILIGIGGTARRGTDYYFPGATAYHEFLTRELVPFVESRFRADKKKRLISGLSASGNFPVHALYLEAPDNLTFTHFLSADAALWAEKDRVQQNEKQMFEAVGGKPLPVTMIFARAFGFGSNSMVIVDLYKQMLARNYADFHTVEIVYPFDHVGTDLPSFEDAVATYME
jgi:hypothetical protein